MPVADPPANRLSARVRAGTQQDHEAAQGSGFLDALAAGRLPLAAYADLAGQHLVVYDTLERAGREMVGDPVAGDFVRPELDRVPALAADLGFLVGPDWPDRMSFRAFAIASRCSRPTRRSWWRSATARLSRSIRCCSAAARTLG